MFSKARHKVWGGQAQKYCPKETKPINSIFLVAGKNTYQLFGGSHNCYLQMAQMGLEHGASGGVTGSVLLSRLHVPEESECVPHTNVNIFKQA